jgi:hypothetical protein
MTMVAGRWRRCPDVAWIGDAARVVAAGTSPPDSDGPRILEGAAAGVWVGLSAPQTFAELVDEFGQPDLIRQALDALAAAALIEPAQGV